MTLDIFKLGMYVCIVYGCRWSAINATEQELEWLNRYTLPENQAATLMIEARQSGLENSFVDVANRIQIIQFIGYSINHWERVQ